MVHEDEVFERIIIEYFDEYFAGLGINQEATWKDSVLANSEDLETFSSKKQIFKIPRRISFDHHFEPEPEYEPADQV